MGPPNGLFRLLAVPWQEVGRFGVFKTDALSPPAKSVRRSRVYRARGAPALRLPWDARGASNTSSPSSSSSGATSVDSVTSAAKTSGGHRRARSGPNMLTNVPAVGRDSVHYPAL